MQRLKELILALHNEHPHRQADVALGNQFVRRRRADNLRLSRTATVTPIALTVVTPTMRSHIDFQDIAIVAPSDFLERLTASRAVLFVLR